MDKYVISVDLGGTNLRVGIISDSCEIIAVYREATLKGNKEALGNQICSLISKLPYQDYNVTKVGISACGLVENNIIKILPNLSIFDFDLKSYIENEFPTLNVEIRNDANCTALAEALFGSAKDYNSSFFITVSTGIGGCFIGNKTLIDFPFEIGNMVMNYNNKQFFAEKLLSGTGIPNLCKENNLEVESAAEFFKKVNDKDELALKVLDIWENLLAQLIITNHFTFNSQIYVLSGGVMKSAHLFYDELLEKCNSIIKGLPYNEIKFTLAHFDQDAGLIGGATVALSL